MVARDPIRKVTLSAHPKVNTDGTSDEPHVGSVKDVGPHTGPGELPSVSGKSSSQVKPSKKKD